MGQLPIALCCLYVILVLQLATTSGYFLPEGSSTLIRPELKSNLSNSPQDTWVFVENNHKALASLLLSKTCIVYTTTCGYREVSKDIPSISVLPCTRYTTLEIARQLSMFIVHTKPWVSRFHLMGVNATFVPIWSVVDDSGNGDHLADQEEDLTPPGDYISTLAGSKSSYSARDWGLLLNAFSRRSRLSLKLAICSNFGLPKGMKCFRRQGCFLFLKCTQSQLNTLLANSRAFVFTVKRGHNEPRGLRSISQALAQGVPIISPRKKYLEGYTASHNTYYYKENSVASLTAQYDAVARGGPAYESRRRYIQSCSLNFSSALNARNILKQTCKL